MHVLLLITSLLLVVTGGYGALGLLRGLETWSARRRLQLSVLAAPIVSLAVGTAGLYHLARRVCFLGAPPWDYTLAVVGPVAMGVVVAAALSLGAARLGLMCWAVTRRTVGGGPELQAIAERLAERLGVAQPRVLVCPSARPLALACRLHRPTVVLSSWMAKNLDDREMEAVLAHELGHAARHDYLMTLLATTLRDAFFYLPTSWAAYRQLQADNEIASDDLAVSVTQRPLALASALAKVWQQSLAGPPQGAAQSFAGADMGIEHRIERLIAGRSPDPRTLLASCMQNSLARIGAPALTGLLALQAAMLIVMLFHLLSCGLGSLLGRMS